MTVIDKKVHIVGQQVTRTFHLRAQKGLLFINYQVRVVIGVV